LHALVTEPGGPADVTEPALLAQAFTELDLRNVTGNLDLPAADRILLELTRMIAADEVTPERVAIAVALFHDFSVIDAALVRGNWTADIFLTRLLDTIGRLNETDRDNTAAMAYVLELVNNL
jgi:hypothetical protein